MMRPRDPRVRQTINQISHNIESANETAQESLYTFSQNYIVPCFAAIGNCIYACASPCLPTREDHLRRRRRGRAEASFDFYDDWDNEDTNDSLLGWGTDELDRLLAGSGLTRGSSEQPRRQRKMSYGTRGPRRKSSVLVPDNRNDPTVIPHSSFLGFLEGLPWRLGARGIKYRPSAADLQEHPSGLRRHVPEDEPLLEAADESDERVFPNKNGRNRSSTQSSRETANSLSSRGDLIPSDDEEDAVPLDDEFAMALASRRGTGLDLDEQLSDKFAGAKRSISGTSLGTLASKESRKKKKHKRLSSQSSQKSIAHQFNITSIPKLKKEEERAELEEESEITRKRLAAHRLAVSRGLDQGQDKFIPQSIDARSPSSTHALESVGEIDPSDPLGGMSKHEPGQRHSEDAPHTEPFPPLPLPPSSEAGPHEDIPASQAISSQHLSSNTRSADLPDS